MTLTTSFFTLTIDDSQALGNDAMAYPLDLSWLTAALWLGAALTCLALPRLIQGWSWTLRAPVGAPLAPAALQPERLGPYRLAGKIGQGAMGEVYRAYHSALGGWRAVKLLPPDATERERERFAREARLGAALQHPNTVSIYEHGEEPHGCYYAMELLEGTTLQELVERDGPQPAERVVPILLQLCSALQAMHERGFVHRDVKPENVLLTGDELSVAKLIDFGLVEHVSTLAKGQPEGTLIGTPLYISPEAIRAPETVGPRSDLYGLGAVAHFLLRGAPVFHGRSVIEVCSHHLHTPPEPLSSALGAALPADLERVILDCLAKDPADRPASTSELEHRLARCLPTTSPAPASSGNARRPARRQASPRRDVALEHRIAA